LFEIALSDELLHRRDSRRRGPRLHDAEFLFLIRRLIDV